MHTRQEAHDRLDLVRLERPDEVPADARIPERLGLPREFLRVVFAEVSKPGLAGREHHVRPPGLRDRDQRHLRRMPAGAPAGGLHALPDALHVPADALRKTLRRMA